MDLLDVSSTLRDLGGIPSIDTTTDLMMRIMGNTPRALVSFRAAADKYLQRSTYLDDSIPASGEDPAVPMSDENVSWAEQPLVDWLMDNATIFHDIYQALQVDWPANFQVSLSGLAELNTICHKYTDYSYHRLPMFAEPKTYDTDKYMLITGIAVVNDGAIEGKKILYEGDFTDRIAASVTAGVWSAHTGYDVVLQISGATRTGNGSAAYPWVFTENDDFAVCRIFGSSVAWSFASGIASSQFEQLFNGIYTSLAGAADLGNDLRRTQFSVQYADFDGTTGPLPAPIIRNGAKLFRILRFFDVRLSDVDLPLDPSQISEMNAVYGS
jgi:hypothetical protein